MSNFYILNHNVQRVTFIFSRKHILTWSKSVNINIDNFKHKGITIGINFKSLCNNRRN